MQESQRIEDRVGRLPKRFEQSGQRGLSRARAFRMTAHPVDHDQQHRLLRGRHCDSILIFIAMADEADIGGLDLQ
jgi:hypothetical protein